jgi:hypothetical protein
VGDSGAPHHASPRRLSISAAIFMVPTLRYVSETAYGRMTRSPWRIPPHV